MAQECLAEDSLSVWAAGDLRYLVLLVFALVLLLAQWSGLGRPAWQRRGEGGPFRSPSMPLWLTGSRISNGLYLLPASWLVSGDGMEKLYENLGLTPPDGAPAGGIDPAMALKGLHLEDRQLPRPVAVPARIFPILFKPLPINRSTASEIAMLPGIGPRLAERIVATRRARGAFHRKKDLLAVYGLGIKKFARLRHLVSVE